MSSDPTVFPNGERSTTDTVPGKASRVSPQSLDGLVIPGYELQERLGRGGFATVYRAHQETFDRDVAIKVLLGDLSDPGDARQFTNECRTLGRLSAHPAVVDVHDAGTTSDGRGYIVMRLYGGGSIAKRLEEQGPLPVDDAIEIGMRMADALASAHSQQVIHRDIKPENILIDDVGRSALSDFGVAAIADPDGRFTSSMAFSRQHVAPEVLLRNAYGMASDIYGLTSTLYAMCAGRPPFQYSAEAAQISAILQDAVPDIERDDLPPEFMDLLRIGLAKDPRLRFRDARALHQALRSIRGRKLTPDSRQTAALPSAASSRLPSPSVSSERRGWALLMVTAIAVLAGVGVGALILLALSS